MNRVIFFLLFWVAAYSVNAQCDLAVEIKANPSADLCLGESVQLIAVTNQEVEIPANCETVANLTCEVGSVNFTAGLDNGTSVNAQGASLPDVFGDINEGQVRSQIIYQAQELKDKGFEGGKIKGLQFEIASVVGDATIPNFEIQIGCTPDADFASSFITSGLNTVFDNKSVTLSPGYNTFNFDRAYNWNGVDNLVIQICLRAPNGNAGNFKNYTRDQFLSFPAVRVARKILATTDCAITDNSRNSNQRPNTRFLTCKPQLKDFTYSWTPTATLSDPTARAPFANPTVNTTYSVSVFENSKPSCVATDNITINVIDPGNFTPTANSPLCVGSSLILNANTTADGYLWIGPNGFTSTNANPVINNVGTVNSGTYTVFIDKGFCKANRTVQVQVQEPLSAGTALPDPVICNNIATYNLAQLLTGQDQNATSAWSDDDASGVLTGSTIRPIDIPNAVLPKTFDFTYSLSNTCGTASTTVSITIHPAPYAGEDGQHSVCNNINSSFDLDDFLNGIPNTGGTWIDFESTGVMNPNGTVNLFNFPPSTYTFYYKVTGPGTCVADSAKVDVRVEDYKVAGTGSTRRICRGNSLDLDDLLTGADPGGLWVDVNSSGGLTNPNTGAFNSTPVAPGTYTFNYVVDNIAPCTDEVSSVSVTVTKKPEIFNPNTFCNASETFYQVKFEVRDGNPATLNVVVTANGITYGATVAQQGGIWFVTTDPIPEGEEVFITISDADNCGTSTYNIRKRCGCATDAGVISVGPQQTICDGSFYTVNYLGGFINDGDDIFEFILHDSPTSTIGNVFARNRTGTFGFVPGLMENTTYYISVVAGDEVGGQVDLTDDCLDSRIGQPVQFISLPDPVLDVDPDTSCIGANVTLSASGFSTNGITYKWEGPGVTSSNLQFQINGLTPGLVGKYNFIVTKSICKDTFSINLPAYPVAEVVVPSNFVACEAVLDSIPIQLNNVATATARFQTQTFQIIDVPLVNGTNYLLRTFNNAENLTLREVFYPKGCTSTLNKVIKVTLEQAPDISFDLASSEVICSSANPEAQIQFSLNPPSAKGKIIYEVSGFQFPDQPIIGNDSIISVSAIFDGENVFKIRRFISTPKGCSYALDFGSETFYNYQEPDVSFDVDNNKICRGDTAYIPISVSASDSVIIEYSINGVKKTITASADTLLAVKEDFDFDFSIDSVYYASGDGCGKLIDLQQIFEVKDPINFAVTPVKNDCAGETKGQILLSAEGANTTFSLDGSTYFQRTSFDNLASGTYTVFAKAESGCISVKQATIQNKSNLKIDVESKSTTCGNVNGELKVTASLGSEPYHIFINDEEVSNGLFQNDLTEGTYRIYAYDNLTCEVFDTIVIQPSTGVDFSFTENGPIGCDAPDAGVVTIAATGGSGNFTYQLNEQPPQASNVFNGLFAQFYTLRVIDATDGCVKEKRMRIKPQKLFPFTVRILGDLNCSYSKNGRVEAITENNGTTYLYSLDGVNYSFNKLFTNVSAGQFQLYAKELDGCRREQVLSFNMTAPPKLKSRVVYTEDVDCWNAKDGVVGLEGSAGNGGPYKYKRIGETFKANAVFTNLGQGLHTFVTQDNKGCTDTLKVNINGPDTVVVNVTKIDSGNGKATLRVSATNTYLLTLYSLDGINYTTNPVFPDVAPGTYTLYIRDQLGCETVYTFSFTVTGISERVEQLFTVYPNPFENNLRIQFKKAPNTDITNNIRLFDITGKQVEIEVQKLNESSFEIYSDIDLAKGTYIIQAAGKSLKIQKN